MIKRNQIFIFNVVSIMFLSLILITACKHSETGKDKDYLSNPTSSPRVTYTEETEGEELTERVSQVANASYVVEVDFPKGTDKLTEVARERLSNLLHTARAAGRVDEIKVLSWGDQEYPSEKQKKLSTTQRDLADHRNENVENYIDSMGFKVDVDTYNMAEQPHLFSKWFNTSDARLKKSLVAAGLPTTADALQYPSKASHSIVMILLE